MTVEYLSSDDDYRLVDFYIIYPPRIPHGLRQVAQVKAHFDGLYYNILSTPFTLYLYGIPDTYIGTFSVLLVLVLLVIFINTIASVNSINSKIYT